MKVTAFLSGLAFLLAYIFDVFKVKVGIAIQPEALLFAGLFFLVLAVAGFDAFVSTRTSRTRTVRD
jgi:hypothetical protein